MRTFFVFLLLFLISCSNKNNLPAKTCSPPESKDNIIHNVEIIKTIYVDSRFNASEKLAIISAKYAWEHATKGIIKYNLVFDFKIDPDAPIPKKIIIMKLSSTDPVVKNIDSEVGEDFITLTLAAKGTELILIVADRVHNTDTFKKLVIKEFGFDLGLPSIREEDMPAVMNELTPDANCLTKADLYLFCQKYMCNHEKLNYCDGNFKTKNKIDKL